MTSPPDRLPEIRQRRAAITPPPWDVTTTTDDQWFVHSPKFDAEIVVHDGDHTLDFAGTERTSEFIAHAPTDIDWLVGEVTDRRREVGEFRGEVEQLRGESRRLRDDIALLDAHHQESFGMADELDTAHKQVEQLRGLLRRLEWVGRDYDGATCCPACQEVQGGHASDCELAAAIRSTSGEEQP